MLRAVAWLPSVGAELALLPALEVFVWKRTTS